MEFVVAEHFTRYAHTPVDRLEFSHRRKKKGEQKPKLYESHLHKCQECNLITCAAGTESWMWLNRSSTSSRHPVGILSPRISKHSLCRWRQSKSKTENFTSKTFFSSSTRWTVKVKQGSQIERAFASLAFAYWVRRFGTIDGCSFRNMIVVCAAGPLTLLTWKYCAVMHPLVLNIDHNHKGSTNQRTKIIEN